jgi:hypothetical protein
MQGDSPRFDNFLADPDVVVEFGEDRSDAVATDGRAATQVAAL